MTLGRNLESETRHCFSGINVMVFYKEDLKRFCDLKTVQLRVQDKVNDRSFFFITQGMEGSTYNGQAEIVKQRKRWTFLTQHITNPWHLSQYTKEARNKYYFKKRLEKLMGKSPSALPTWCWGSNLQLRKPLTSWRVQPQNYCSANPPFLLNQAYAAGCHWRQDPRWEGPLVWPTVAISGSHDNAKTLPPQCQADSQPG